MKRLLKFVILLPCWLLTAGYYTSSLTIVSSGTPIALSSAVPPLPANCLSIGVYWVSTDAGTVYVGGSNVNAANKLGVPINSSFPGAYFSPTTNPTNIPAGIFVDGTTNDKVVVSCTR